jgi:hypothetical protein
MLTASCRSSRPLNPQGHSIKQRAADGGQSTDINSSEHWGLARTGTQWGAETPRHRSDANNAGLRAKQKVTSRGVWGRASPTNDERGLFQSRAGWWNTREEDGRGLALRRWPCRAESILACCCLRYLGRRYTLGRAVSLLGGQSRPRISCPSVSNRGGPPAHTMPSRSSPTRLPLPAIHANQRAPRLAVVDSERAQDLQDLVFSEGANVPMYLRTWVTSTLPPCQPEPKGNAAPCYPSAQVSLYRAPLTPVDCHVLYPPMQCAD